MDTEKKEFAGWWLWVLLLVIVSIGALSITGFGSRFLSVTADRVIFENSYQKSAADKAKQSALQSQLSEIEARLRSSNLTDEMRVDLEAQASGMRVQLNALEN